MTARTAITLQERVGLCGRKTMSCSEVLLKCLLKSVLVLVNLICFYLECDADEMGCVHLVCLVVQYYCVFGVAIVAYLANCNSMFTNFN